MPATDSKILAAARRRLSRATFRLFRSFTALIFAAVLLTALAWPGAAQPVSNPFSLKETGLPYESGRCGNSFPDQLDEQQLRSAVEAAFRSEGVSLQAGYLWRSRAGELYLDGYDSVSRTGYVYLDAYEMGDGTWLDLQGVLNWPDGIECSSLEAGLKEELARFSNPANREWARYPNSEMPCATTPERRAQYLAMFQQVRDDDLASIDRRTVEDYYLEKYSNWQCPYTRPVAELLEAVLIETDSAQRQKHLDRLFLLSRWDLLVRTRWLKTPYLRCYDRLARLAVQHSGQKPGKKRDERLAVLRHLGLVLDQPYEKPWNTFADSALALLEQPARHFWPRARALAAQFERRRASMAEIEALLQEAVYGRRFIIVLTGQHTHTIVPDVGEQLGRIPDSGENGGATRAKWEAERLNLREKAVEKTMGGLEMEVRGFIRWAG